MSAAQDYDELESRVAELERCMFDMQCNMDAVLRPMEKSMEDITLDEIKQQWNDTADNLGLRHVKWLSEKRQKILRPLIRDPLWVENFAYALDEISQSDFLQGYAQSKDGRTWRVTFDWLIDPHNMAKVIEGNYKREEGLAHVRESLSDSDDSFD